VLRIVAEERLVFRIVAEVRLALRIVAETCLVLHIVAGAHLALRTVAEARLSLAVEVVFEEDQKRIPLVSNQTRDKVQLPLAAERSNTVSVADDTLVVRRRP